MDRPKLAKDIMATKLVTVSPDKDVFATVDLLLYNKISGVPVIDEDRNFVGVFSEKCGLRVFATAMQLANQGESDHAASVANKKCARDIMVTRLVTLKPDRDVFEAIGYLLKNRVSGAPVVDDQWKFRGIFSERYCMRVLIESACNQLPTAQVFAFMNTDVGRNISEDVDLMSIAEMFLNTYYRRLEVLRDEKLVGQISRRDVLRAARKMSTVAQERQAALLYLQSQAEAGNVPEEDVQRPILRVQAFMDSEAPTITEETDLLSIANIFLNTNHRRLPVLRDGKLVGQISRRDLLSATHELLAIPPEQETSLLYLSSLMERRDAPIG